VFFFFFKVNLGFNGLVNKEIYAGRQFSPQTIEQGLCFQPSNTKEERNRKDTILKIT